jgi:hypothetical protein
MPTDPQSVTPTPVAMHISGIGNVEIPAGTNISDVHAAILAHPSHVEPEPVAPNVQEPESTDALSVGVPPNITAENALENRDDFRKQAQKAWGMVRMNSQPGYEAGFTVDRDGHINPVTAGVEMDPNNRAQQGGMKQVVTPDTAETLHIHNRGMGPKPSQADIDVAKKIGRPVYVASISGLFQVDAQGNVKHVFSNPDWDEVKKKK